MPRPLARGAESLQAYPNITLAAEMLNVSASTLSRRADLVVDRRGERDRVLSAAEVLRLAAIFRRRSLNDVAQDLLDYTAKAAPEDVSRVEDEIERFFEDRALGNREQLVDLARRLLPAELCKQIEDVLEEKGEKLPDVIVGYPPDPAS